MNALKIQKKKNNRKIDLIYLSFTKKKEENIKTEIKH